MAASATASRRSPRRAGQAVDPVHLHPDQPGPVGIVAAGQDDRRQRRVDGAHRRQRRGSRPRDRRRPSTADAAEQHGGPLAGLQRRVDGEGHRRSASTATSETVGRTSSGTAFEVAITPRRRRSRPGPRRSGAGPVSAVQAGGHGRRRAVPRTASAVAPASGGSSTGADPEAGRAGGGRDAARCR